MLAIRFPLDLLTELQSRGEVTAQIIAAVRAYLDKAALDNSAG